MRLSLDWWAVLAAALVVIMVKSGLLAGIPGERRPARRRKRCRPRPDVGACRHGRSWFRGHSCSPPSAWPARSPNNRSRRPAGPTHLTLPNIEYVLWAIAFGLLVSNTVGIPEIFRPGVDTYEFWLKTGIVLMGVRFLLGDVVKLGGVSLCAWRWSWWDRSP